MCNTNKKHFDVVGSFLRPEVLKTARKDYEEKKISFEELKQVEDIEIEKLIDKQIEVGLPFVTDGEFRRALWHLDFFWGFNGVERRVLEKGYQFVDLETRGDTATIVGRISGENHPFVEHFKFVAKYVGDRSVPKQTIPAPAQFLVELLRPENEEPKNRIYPDTEVLLQDVVSAYTTVIRDLYDAGCRNIQLDDCTWGIFLDPESLKKVNIPSEVVDNILDGYLRINNAVIDSAPNDLIINTHVCRGNYHSHHAFVGGYDRVADVLFEKENVDAFYLEFDDERSGDFKSLKKVNNDKKVVLGLVTTKNGELESKDELIRRVKEASEFVPLDRLLLSPQCGFASTEEGNIITEQQQWDKIALVKEVAEEIWK